MFIPKQILDNKYIVRAILPCLIINARHLKLKIRSGQSNTMSAVVEIF